MFIYDDVSFLSYVRCIIQLNLFVIELSKIQAFLVLLIYWKTEEQMSNSRYSQKSFFSSGPWLIKFDIPLFGKLYLTKAILNNVEVDESCIY